MKTVIDVLKHHILFVFVFLFSNSIAQDDAITKKIAERKDRIVFDVNYDAWLNTPKDIKQKVVSPGVNFYLMWDYPFGYGPMSFAFGLGLSSHNVHSNAQMVYSIDGEYTSLTAFSTPYKKNKLSCNYIEVPIELRLRTRGEKSFKMAIGAKVGYAYNIHTKIIDDDGKRKMYDIKNINPLRYGPIFRIGYNKWNVNAFYSLSELFLKDKGTPKLVQYSIGIGLILY